MGSCRRVLSVPCKSSLSDVARLSIRRADTKVRDEIGGVAPFNGRAIATDGEEDDVVVAVDDGVMRGP